MSEFDESYYKTVNYIDFLQRKGRYVKLTEDIDSLLQKLNLDNGPVLDFGCAVGFVVEAMEDLGYQDVRGVDISEWAVGQCIEKGLNVSTEVDFSVEWGLTFCLDVLEHMKDEDMQNFLYNLSTEVMVFRVPVCANEGEDYVLECSRRDPTHRIRWTSEQWKIQLEDSGYHVISMNLPTIYTSDGVFAGLAIKV
jgi:predicted TPR repeat methyltransferase